MKTAIKVEKLGKKYIIGHQRREPYVALRDVITDKFKHSLIRINRRIYGSGKNDNNLGRYFSNNFIKEEFWALKDVSFDIEQGEMVGVIGRNGAGKSTLLKLLSRITEPTAGRIETIGRVASLLEVGTGFHPELTGRENIFLNGAILGMIKSEIRKKFDEIVAFAEVEKFLDIPVKHYSSGMYVRLAFAVAAHLEPEILLVDEVLAVGDAAFQKKCLGKIEEVSKKEGRTILFVSHNMGAIRRLCHRAILLSGGKILEDGLASSVTDKYLASVLKENEITNIQNIVKGLPVDHAVRMNSININQDGRAGGNFINGKDIEVEFNYEIFETLDKFFLNLQLWDAGGNYLTEAFHNLDKSDTIVYPGVYTTRAIIPGKFLLPVTYELKVYWGIFKVRDFIDPIGITLNIRSDGVSNMAYAVRPLYGRFALPI